MTEHAIARAKERFGLNLTATDMSRIIATIMNGDTLLLGRYSGDDDMERHLLRYAGVAMVAVYAKDPPAIVTLQEPRAKRDKRKARARRSKRRARKRGPKREWHNPAAGT